MYDTGHEIVIAELYYQYSLRENVTNDSTESYEMRKKVIGMCSNKINNLFITIQMLCDLLNGGEGGYEQTIMVQFRK